MNTQLPINSDESFIDKNKAISELLKKRDEQIATLTTELATTKEHFTILVDALVAIESYNSGVKSYPSIFLHLKWLAKTALDKIK